jgi:hypothetical protein
MHLRSHSPFKIYAMPKKRKASAARAEGLRAAHEALSAKRLRATPEHSDMMLHALKGEPEHCSVTRGRGGVPARRAKNFFFTTIYIYF